MPEPSNKEKILVAAQELFGARNFSRTTLKQVADKAGVAFGLVAHHYGSKELLYLTSCTEAQDVLHEGLQRAVAHRADGFDGVKKFVNHTLAFTSKDPTRAMVLVHCAPYNQIIDPDNLRRIRERYDGVLNELIDLIEEGMADRSIRMLDNPAVAGLTLYGMLAGVMRTRLLLSGTPAEVYPQAVDFICRAIENR
jgi:AcrR family transcriptional regulator